MLVPNSLLAVVFNSQTPPWAYIWSTLGIAVRIAVYSQTFVK